MFGETYAGLYDVFYRDRPVEQECDFVVGTARNHGSRAQTLLDLGCGTGAHLAGFARRGLACHGVDRSNAMLARARAAALPVTTGDVRDVRLGRRFDVVVALFHVLSYMTSDDDVAALLATAAAHLADGGVFIADFWHAPAVRAQGASRREVSFEWNDRHVTRTARPRARADGGVDVHYEVVVRDAGGRTERVEERHPMRAFAVADLERAASCAGLALARVGAWLEARAPGEQDWSAYLVAGSAG